LLIDALRVGGRQKVAATIESRVPGVPVRTIGSRKHCRGTASQVWPAVQSSQLPGGGGFEKNYAGEHPIG
jgi:hypothetical protein